MMNIIEQLTQELQFHLGIHPIDSDSHNAFFLGALLILGSLDASNGNTCNGLDEGAVAMDAVIRSYVQAFNDGEGIGMIAVALNAFIRNGAQASDIEDIANNLLLRS